jgi:hypothetical protein
MDEILLGELQIYRDKSAKHSLKESWIEKNLPNLYNYFLDKKGRSFAEKIYLLDNSQALCKVCNAETKFLSTTRGYREYCSKKCSNGDSNLSKIKAESFKKTSLEKWGVDNPAKNNDVKHKIKKTRATLDNSLILEKSKKTTLEKWGVENVSQADEIKKKKAEKTLKNWGVDNPFQSETIKEIIKEKHLERFGVDHPLKSDWIKSKIKETVLEKWIVDNPAKSNLIKDKKFNNRNSGLTKSTLNQQPNFVSYLGGGLYEMKCEQGHTYEITRHLYHARVRIKGKLCTVCNPIGEMTSVKEEGILNWIREIYHGEVLSRWRDGLEIDIYLPDLKIGFEINGLYWHSEVYKKTSYHVDKSNYFKGKGIRIYHIWEDDLENRLEIVKSQIVNWIGLSSNRIFARKCEIKEVTDSKIIREFLEQNHIQGSIRTSLNVGLFYNSELVSLMTFDHTEGRKNMLDGGWNLSRFCNKTNSNVVGGASKLLKYFIDRYKPTRIISFADKAWSDGALYFRLGFRLVNETEPDYKYVIDKKRVNKQRFKKSNLVAEGFSNDLSESEIMLGRGIYKIWDCGQLKFEFRASSL